MRTIAISARPEGRIVTMGLVVCVLTILLAFIFIWAGVEKWSDPADFEVSVVRLELFPDWMTGPIVAVIPVLEIVAGLMCLAEGFVKPALKGLLILTILYTVLLAWEWILGMESGCGCFGALSAHWPHWALLARNLGLLLIEGFLLRAKSNARMTAPVATTEAWSTA
jgi:uncharacterized membrane protein YphA (DoxX/SURF4 family)